MCGIAGYVDSHSPASKSLISDLCKTIAHRGPDDEGILVDGRVALGHRRLSIIDVSGGGQPLGNEDGTVQIIFNGEIYNYLEIREELVAKGHRFQTHSDTEVLVHLYEEEGERLAERLNGMFAFAIWDRRNGRILLARDRFGKKPLYYSTEQPGIALCFASELKALAALPRFEAAVRPESVADYLALGYVPDPHTIYRSVKKLPPSHTLLWGPEGVRLRRYWTPEFDPHPSMNFDAAREELAHLAADSVRCRLMSEVPLGGFLSGGIDSSAVVALMAQQSSQAVKSFSIGFTDTRFDETQYARMVASRYQTQHQEEVVSPSIGEMLNVLVKHYDEPFADSSAVPTLYLSRMTRRHVTVALSGDGADEIFGGYRRYRLALAENAARQYMPRWFRRSAVAAMAGVYPKMDWAPQVFRAKTTLRGISQDLGEAYFATMSGFGFGLLDRVLSPELQRGLNGYSPREDFVARFEKYRHLSALQQLQAVDLETYLPGDILVKVDRATMAYSLESRAPWLDYRMGQLAGRMPSDFKIRGGSGKFIFKEAMKPHLPAEIFTRRKMGFSVPLASWFRTSLKPVVESIVLQPEMEHLFNVPLVRGLYQTHLSGIRDYSRELWTVLMLACWERFHRRNGAEGELQEALSAPGTR
jgi:asparagine synthase (glutamine-hydrolysing)